MQRDEFEIKLREAAANIDDCLPMEPELWAAGCDLETANFAARMLRQQGYYLVNPDKIDWTDIHRFHDEAKKGQDIYEDAGGYFVRKIKALLRIKVDPVTNYQNAAKALLSEHEPNT
jgi:hypothetical protein